MGENEREKDTGKKERGKKDTWEENVREMYEKRRQLHETKHYIITIMETTVASL